MKTRNKIGLLVSPLLLALGLAVAPAHADTLTVAPGMKITWGNGTGWCTLGGVGVDAAGNRLGLTAGHCMAKAGDDVYLDTDQGTWGTTSGVGKHIGKYVSWTNTWTPVEDSTVGAHDWAFIQLDPSVHASTVTPDGFNLDHLGKTPSLFQIVTKDGRRTGVSSGPVTAVNSDGTIVVLNLAWFGDSGSPMFDQGNGLLGLTDSLSVLPPWATYTPLSNILADAAAQGGPGAGWHPAAS